MCSQTVIFRSNSLISELSMDLAVLADSAGTRTTGAAGNMVCELSTRTSPICCFGVTGALLRRIAKLANVEKL